mmetsp:Transcript_39807/g.93012  ORF Transcript_39807/g.93012 Transcript_39807/m.93012 type:complete len:353 (+) Transcript_39807:1277-2335(+)
MERMLRSLVPKSSLRATLISASLLALASAARAALSIFALCTAWFACVPSGKSSPPPLLGAALPRRQGCSSNSISRTTNSTSCARDMAALNGAFQKSSGCSSVLCIVHGSSRWSTLETLETMARLATWPMALAVAGGNHTRSSRQRGNTSAEYVNLCRPLPVCVSCEISCFECFVRTGATDARNETSFSACAREPKKKSTPSRASTMLVVSVCARCFNMSCSSHRKVRLCGTFCRICTTATQVSFASRRWHAVHCLLPSTYSTTNDCCSTAAAATSFCTVSLSLMRRECGSVQMKEASTRRTLVKPRGLRNSSARSSFDSGSTAAHEPSRRSKRSQPRHVFCCTCLLTAAPIS